MTIYGLDIAADLDRARAELQAARATITQLEHALDQAVEDLASERATVESLRVSRRHLREQAEAAQIRAARDATNRPAPTSPSAHPTLPDWVERWLVPNIERDTGTKLRWCRRWHEHPEAVWRLHACWQDYERMHNDPRSGITLFARNSLDPQLALLMSATGPFSACSSDRHEPVRTLPQTDWSRS